MKKVLLAALVLIMTVALVACGTPSNQSGLKIAIVSSPSGVDDGSFNQDNYEGILAFIAANPGATETHIREQDVANSIPAVEAIVADYDVIVLPGFQFAGIVDLANNNPDKKFILVDSFPTEADFTEVSLPNV